MAAASDAGTGAERFVLDCSVALAWCFPDERSASATAVLDSLADLRAVVPGVWPYEVANALLMGERRRRSTREDTAAWLRFLAGLPIAVDEGSVSRGWSDLVAIARRLGLSAYDAAYLDLAVRHALPLATLDRRLQEAAKASGVVLYAA